MLDLGCGSGTPITTVLTEAGCRVHGIDASPRLVAEFRRSFPQHRVICEAVEVSSFFGMQFDAAVAIGLLFLLPEDDQHALIARVSRALKPGGRFLFTAPVQKAEWMDLLTQRRSISLGDVAYKSALQASGLSLCAEHIDEGGNHYYDALRMPDSQTP